MDGWWRVVDCVGVGVELVDPGGGVVSEAMTSTATLKVDGFIVAATRAAAESNVSCAA